MQSSRDSSVLRSLAIAFGDGLAFGVGMKLSQQKARGQSSSALALPEPELLDRIENIERRVQKVEAIPAALASGGAGQPIDSKVLEAVVGALDARLAEQTTATERRLRDLEAKLTIELKTLHQQDHSVATGLQERIADLHEQFSGQVGEIRQKSEAAHAAYRTELAALHRQFALETAKAVEAGLSAKDAQYRQMADSLRAALDEHARTATARHQTLEAGLAANGAQFQQRLDSQHAALRAALDEHARTAEARHQSAEAGLTGRVENLRTSLTAATAHLLDQSLAESRDASNRQIDELRTSVAGESAALGQRIDDLRTAASADATRLIDEALARNNAEVAGQLADLHAALDEHVRAAAAREAGLTAQFEARIAAMQGEFTAAMTSLIQERVAQGISEQLVPLRAELETKDRELQLLRQKLAESDRHAANLFLAIGQACRDAAERIMPVAVAATPEPAKPEPADPADAPTQAAGSDEGLPGFVQSKPPGKLLRIPLVSSMAMALAACAALLYYL